MTHQLKTTGNRNQLGGATQLRTASPQVKIAQRGPSNNQNATGNQQQSATTTTTDKDDFVLCLWNNDFPDCDNALVLDVWMKMVKGAQKAYGKDAVQKLTVFELNRVNLAIDRINGSDVGTILIPMCAALFNDDGIFKNFGGAMKRDPAFNEKVMEDLKTVREKHAFSMASTFMQAGLSRGLVNAMVRNKEIMKGLRDKKFKAYEDKACSCDKTKPGTTCNSCNDKNEWIGTQLNKLVPSVDPAGWIDDSVMTGMLVVQDFLKGLDERKLLDSDDKFYLDVGGLAEIDAPLERRMEHPSFLVNYESLVPEYQKAMSSSKPEDMKRQEIRFFMERKLEDGYKKMMDKTTLKGPDRYQLIVREAKKAKKVFMFGGSSMTLLSRVMSQVAADKIEFIGQGGTSDPSLNLTGNPFNWELNLWATYDVLSKHAKGPERLGSFQLGTTELGKRVIFRGQDLADHFGHRFGRRAAAFGVTTIKTNPENANLRGNNYTQYFTKDGQPVPIMCPDLNALFARFAKEKFRDVYCKLSPLNKIHMVSKEGVRKVEGKPVKKRSVVRVKFATGPAKEGEALSIKNIIQPWDPRQTAAQFVAKGHLDPIVQECVATFITQVGAALGRPAQPQGGVKRAESLPTAARTDPGAAKRTNSLATSPPSQEPVKRSATIPKAHPSQGDQPAGQQVRRAEQPAAHGRHGQSQGVGSGNQRQGSGQPVNGTAQRQPPSTVGSVSGRRVVGGASGTANGTRSRDH